jgi:hypothetical protein
MGRGMSDRAHTPSTPLAPLNAATHWPVPDDFRGVWMRTLRQTDTDAEAPPPGDVSTWARRLQTSLWRAELRIPDAAMRDRRAVPLAEASAQHKAALATQQGSAGITQFETLPEGQICTWLRRIDYQPPGLQPDAGWMMFDRDDRLIEIGVHEDYNEVWVRLPDSIGRFVALAGLAEDGAGGTHDTGARLLVAGDYMMRVRPRTQRWPRGMTPGYTLPDVLVHSPDQAVDWLDCEVSFGRLQDGRWTVEHSTLPELEGQSVAWQARVEEDEATANVQHDGVGSRWQILEWTCDSDSLGA